MWSRSFIIMMLLASCSVSDSDKEQSNTNKSVVPYTEGIHIGWDFKTLTRVVDRVAYYPRIIRLQSGELLCAFESERNVYITRSSDEGKNWSNAKLIAPSNGVVGSAVPELIQLVSGRILLAYNTRPPADNQNPDKKFGIKLRISEDGGYTWTEQQNVFEGGYEWNRGVWEPAMIQLETGEVQLFFANEFPYDQSKDQEISMVRSFDDGKSWMKPVTISYREGYRDGMPVPLILQNKQGIVVAIEDNGMGPGEFKPAIIWSSMDDNWKQDHATGNSARRWRALTSNGQLDPSDYGGAPYIRQLPSGQTLLSFQGTENRTHNWTKSTMTVAIGDEQAHNFSRKSEPFDVPEDRAALWSSIFIKNDTTVTAVTSTTAYSSSGRSELYTIDGYVNQPLKAPYGEITLDGKLDETVWRQAVTNFMGSKGDACVTVATAWDDNYFYVGSKIEDISLSTASGRSIEENDNIAVMLATGLLKSDSLVEGTYKIYAAPSEQTTTYEGKAGGWSNSNISVDIAVSTDGKNVASQLEIAIPWSNIGGKPALNEKWGINFELTNYDSSTHGFYREVLSGNIEDRPSAWSEIQLIQ